MKNVLPFSKFVKRPQTNFHADTMSAFKVIGSKTGKIYRWVKIFVQLSFSLYRYSIEATTIDIYMPLHV